MKKYITFLLCLIMLLSLVSCNETNDELDAQLSDDAENTTVQETPENTTVQETPENTIVPDNKEDSVIDTVQNEQARQAYGMALRNEIKIYYPILDSMTPAETYFEGIYVVEKGNPTRQTLIDMDKDGIKELILAYDGVFILLHFENDIVYATDFHLSSMETIYTDGSFSWSHTDDIFGYECGISRVSFVNGRKKVEELCRTEGDSKFFISGIQVTKKQYNDYLNKSERTPIAFTAFDITAFDTAFLYNNEWKAIKLASEYWGIKDGDFDPQGLRYRIICKRKIDERWYEVSLYRFVYNSYYEHLEIATVDIETKEIKVTSYPDGKG